jgi:MerR family transcriptional regulator, light-induced transcriptional regulator
VYGLTLVCPASSTCFRFIGAKLAGQCVVNAIIRPKVAEKADKTGPVSARSGSHRSAQQKGPSVTMNADPAPVAASARLRSGTAARLAGVPVATLRVWERRYGVVAAPKTATGQRLYSAHDVQRLRLIKQLTERGQAIGTIATLPLAALQQRVDAEAAALEQRGVADAAPAPEAGPRRMVAVGSLAAARLHALPGCSLQAHHDDLDAAERAMPVPADLLLVVEPSLQPAAVSRLLALAGRLQVRAVVVIYAFGTEAVVQQLRAAGARVRRGPVSAGDLARLVAKPPAPSAAALSPATPGPAPRQFSDAALALLASTPSSVACECPRHLAEIVQQLAGFERYSADCGARSPLDAALHEHLSSVAGMARAMFEQSLLRVMAAEGIGMPG